MKKLICTVCPKGCHLTVDEAHDYQVTGNSCPRGEAFGKSEIRNPVRTVTSTVALDGGLHPRLPVKTSAPIPRRLIPAAMEQIRLVRAAAPISCGEILIKNLLDTGIDLVATKDA